MSRAISAFTLQIVVAVAALAVIALAPPAQGRMLLVPLAGQGIDSLAVWATQAGARIVGRGPLPGSLAVEGIRSDLLGVALHNATLVVAAPAAACGRRG